MSQLPPTIKLLLEDVPAADRSWMQRIVQPINSFIGSVIDSLNGNLELGPNVRSIVRSVSFTNNTSGVPFRFPNTMSARPTLVLVGKIDELGDSPTPLTNAVAVLDWELTQKNEIQINSISGLVANKRYQINLLVF